MSRLVDAARTFEGVRFLHRGRDRQGLDCAGLVWASYAACGLILPDYLLYGPEPHRDGLVRYTVAALGDPLQTRPVRAELLLPGDVLVMRFFREPHHMGIVCDRRYGSERALTLIHANGDAPSRRSDGQQQRRGRVHEIRLTDDMVRRITHVFRRPV